MSTYDLYYFDVPGRAEAAKLILLLAGQKYESKDIKREDWPEAQKDAPFGTVPYLVEHQENGSKFVLGESHAIERYLARKFEFLGKNNQEMAFLESVCDNGSYMVEKFFAAISLEGESKEKAVKQFHEEVVPKYIRYHESLLAKNGNGYYLGQEFTLAEFLNMQMVRVVNAVTGKEIFSEAQSPNIWKMCLNVRNYSVFAKYFEVTDTQLKKHCEQFH
ncbi:hypothetical protein K7432_001798 [Basidiobolus ranarum]|uniref:GST N-terminal domain-containing protein n=1 Tax=Basidiobolus ranarum TaxID=34480 RepID=A0ABR2W8X5_9FUNG